MVGDISAEAGKEERYEPIEHLDCPLGIMFGGEYDGAKAPRSAILPESNVRTHDGAGLSEQVFQILPLAVKWKLG